MLILSKSLTATYIVTVAIALSGMTASAQMQVSIPASSDNCLYEDSTGSISNGSGKYMFVGTDASGLANRSVIAFDIASNVPAGNLIDSASLTLNLSQTPITPTDMALHRLTSPWGEGVSDANGSETSGAPAEADDATWIHGYYDTLLWASPGGDFDPTASVLEQIDGPGQYDIGLSAGMVADLQYWLENPAGNFGWIIIGDEAATDSRMRVDTRNSTSVPNRPVLTVYFSLATDVHNSDPSLPSSYELKQNHPNPFNPSTTIGIDLPTRARVRLDVFNVLGQNIITLVDGPVDAGSHTIEWNGKSQSGTPVPSGVYFYRLQAGDFSSVRKMVLLK